MSESAATHCIDIAGDVPPLAAPASSQNGGTATDTVAGMIGRTDAGQWTAWVLRSSRGVISRDKAFGEVRFRFEHRRIGRSVPPDLAEIRRETALPVDIGIITAVL
jgi:hypothetical protein